MSLDNFSFEGILGMALPTKNGNKIRVSCKKNINVKPYESEEYFAEVEVELDYDISNMERTVMVEILRTSLEYSIYVQVYARSQITQEELMERKSKMEKSLMMLINKLHQVNPNSKLLAEIIKVIK